jgi:hypothetical protein
MTLNSGSSYTVCLNIATQGGCTGTYCDTVFINTCNLTVTLSGTISSGTTCDGTINSYVNGGTPPYLYTWNNGANTPTLSNLCAGYYYLTVTDADGCIANGYTYITDSTSLNCNAFFYIYYNPNGSISFIDSSNTSTGITAWNWVVYDQLQNTVFTSTSQYPVFVPNGNGTYTATLTITTAGGTTCSYTYTFTISNTSPCTLSASIDIIPVSVIGGSDGAIDLTVSGGTAPYSFMWNTGQTTEDITGLSSGTYTAVIYDADTTCPSFTISAYIYEPYDTTGGNYIIDTLTTAILDTCLNFVPDSFYISQIDILNNTTVLVTWTFVGGGQMQTLEVEYTFSANGSYLVILTINCGTKVLSTYASYINIYNVTDIASSELLNTVTLYPNPASTSLYIESIAPYTCSITTLSGQVVAKTASQSQQSLMDVSALPAGMYIISIENNGKTSFSRLVIAR